jgi:hypothetical protein
VSKHYCCSICSTTLRSLHLLCRFEHEVIHSAKDLLVRLDDGGRVELLPDFTEHAALLGIDSLYGEPICIGLGVSACQAQLFSRPHPEQRVAAPDGLPARL